MSESSSPTHSEPANETKPHASALRCIDCGYNLQVTPEDATCPECGLAVATSLSKGGTAKLRDCFVAACRLFTVWLIVYSIQYIVSMAWMLIYWDRTRSTARIGADVVEIMLPVLLPPMLNGVAVVVVWCFAPWLARMAIRWDRPLALGAGMRALDVFCVGLCLIGAWLIVNALLDFIFYVAQGFEKSRRFAPDQFGTKVTTQEWVTALASIVAGVLLIHYGRRRLPAWPKVAAQDVDNANAKALND